MVGKPSFGEVFGLGLGSVFCQFSPAHTPVGKNFRPSLLDPFKSLNLWESNGNGRGGG
ncbi:hypothetical protein [Synechocystis salina]|uniref:hypothetical protein n=1 Tax=Synechocystis salina TaxID=945780 RepID=UPI00187FD50C|nr:hypothetical protein [Synechocystis salina]